jgi:hypothetical protein
VREVTFDHDFIEHATSVIATDRKIIAQISSEDNNFTPDAHGKQSLLGISTICVGPANCDSRRNVAGFYASRVLGLLSGSGSIFGLGNSRATAPTIFRRLSSNWNAPL